MAGTKMDLLIAGLLLVAATTVAHAQNCGCAKGFCCSKYGYCGTSAPYCGDGCKSGPCYNRPPTPSGGGGGGGVSVADVVTQKFFDGIIGQAGAGCRGKRFYTRQAFLDAVKQKYPSFGRDATAGDSKREIAAFFAHATHETGHFCYVEEVDKSHSYCDTNYPQYPCAPRKKYYGRGPLQITWNYNYALAGKDIGFDGLKSPETVSNDVVISFKTALWFWKNNVHSVVNQGFGATIRAINSIECNGGNTGEMNDRVNIYKKYCNQFGVSPGDHLTC